MPLESVNEGEEATVESGQFEDDDVVITEKKYKELVAGNIVPKGDYVLQITAAEKVTPADGGNMGGTRYRFLIQTPPSGAQMPEGGWPKLDLLIKKFLNPTEKDKNSERIDDQTEAKMFKACGIQAPFKKGEARQAIVGRSIIFAVTQTEKDGTIYQNLKNPRPVAG